MRIAPISNYYSNYNKVNSQYKQQANTPKSYNEPVFTGADKRLVYFTGEKDRNPEEEKLENMKLERVYRQVPRWEWGSCDGTDTIKATYKKYPEATMALANLDFVTGQNYDLDADFIAEAAPLWARGHSDLIIRYLINHGYNECKYDNENLKPFIETFYQDSETGRDMMFYAQKLNKDSTSRFSPTGVMALAENYKYYPEIDDFVDLEEDDGTYFSSCGERIVKLAELYHSSPDNSARLLQLRNHDGKRVFNEKLLETYEKYPEAFEEFLKVTGAIYNVYPKPLQEGRKAQDGNINEKLVRFNNLYFYDVLVPAYAKYPDRLEEFAQVVDYIKGKGDRYRFNDAEVARLTMATGDKYYHKDNK